MNSEIFILSIHGGGIRGVMSAQILSRLEEDLKKPLNKTFDMCGSTSSGSIILAGAFYADMSCKRIVTELFNKKMAKKLMNKSCIDKIFNIFQLKPKYTTKGLEEIINKFLPKKFVSDCDKDTLIFSFNMDRYEPRIYKSFDNDGSKIKDAVMSSVSAPTYFPIHEDSVSGEYNIDGGCYAADPTDCIYAEAIKRYGLSKKIKILSIGTGYSIPKYNKKMKNYGGLNWLLCGNLIPLLFGAPMIAVDYKTNVFTKALNHDYLQINCDSCGRELDDTSGETIRFLTESGNDIYEKNKKELMEFFKEK
jgi:patatin-like phospholipase/acyl hydrolase